MPLHLTSDACRRIQCFAYHGEVSAQDYEDCKQRGFWPPLTCADERCQPYEKCREAGYLFLTGEPQTNVPLPPLPQIVQNTPLDPASLQSVLPSATPPPSNEPGPLCPSTGTRYTFSDPFCRLGEWLGANQGLAILAVLGVWFLASRSKS
jgi:hypothetical protein